MEFDCSFSVSEHGSTNFLAGNLRLGSSNEHVVAQHCVELSLVETFLVTFTLMFSVPFQHFKCLQLLKGFKNRKTTLIESALQ